MVSDSKSCEEWQEKLQSTSTRLLTLSQQGVGEGEVPNTLKLIQICLKHSLMESDKIKGYEA